MFDDEIVTIVYKKKFRNFRIHDKYVKNIRENVFVQILRHISFKSNFWNFINQMQTMWKKQFEFLFRFILKYQFTFFVSFLQLSNAIWIWVFVNMSMNFLLHEIDVKNTTTQIVRQFSKIVTNYDKNWCNVTKIIIFKLVKKFDFCDSFNE